MASTRRKSVWSAGTRAGHDGRWPQPFPVEERLGERGGAQTADCRRRAPWDTRLSATPIPPTPIPSPTAGQRPTSFVMRAGAPVKNNQPWSGGEHVPSVPAMRSPSAMELLPKVRALGFEGTHLHRRDLHGLPPHLSCARPSCHTRRAVRSPVESQFCALHDSSLAASARRAASTLPRPETGLWPVRFLRLGDCPPWRMTLLPPLATRLSWLRPQQSYSKTVNPTNDDLLKVVEYGGRPTFYYDSKFVTPDPNKDVNWMGENDYHCHTPEDRQSSAEWIARVYRWYEGFAICKRLRWNAMRSCRTACAA